MQGALRVPIMAGGLGLMTLHIHKRNKLCDCGWMQKNRGCRCCR